MQNRNFLDTATNKNGKILTSSVTWLAEAQAISSEEDEEDEDLFRDNDDEDESGLMAWQRAEA